jgi:hypothetical protein
MVSTGTLGRLRGWDGLSLGVGTLSSSDPLGFNAGDTNLYRYVHNDPTDFTDPDELQVAPAAGPTVVKKPNEPLYLPEYPLLPKKPGYKEKVIRDVGEIKAPVIPDCPNKTGVMGGEHIHVTNIPQGQVIGSSAADPCIGLIISTLNKDVNIYNFQATECPQRTLFYDGPFPKGSHAAIFGGNGSIESNATLDGVMGYLNSTKCIIDGYSDTIGSRIRDGKYVRFPNDVPSVNKRGK